ncbi:hypothetical protein GA0074704_0859 [Micromonospora siamensis]|uniref:PD-(D/E)XK nuclease superfamily protein n=1 Tax=Micromonospora siamensis TaxID=299152 RepID=A0A1C5H0S9_9ACTN|nr:hypothetical protein GA0074704_0859 [Micromonospora siamensis]
MTGAPPAETLIEEAWDDEDGEASEDLGSGYFTDRSRLAALSAALPFVATYFVRSDQLRLQPAAVVGTHSVNVPGQTRQAVDPVLAALRLRAALVSGRQLIEVLVVVLRNANFRYEQVRDVQVGHLHGRLDVPRYLQQRGRRSSPRHYPVVDLQRSRVTPENTLAAFALHWLVAELDVCLLLLGQTAGAPEGRAAAQTRADLVRLGTHPTFRAAAVEAARAAQRETVGELLDRVEARLRAGHVTRAGGYEQLAAWVRRAISGEPEVAEGELAAAFYGPQFDDKLFELWCLAQLTAAISRLLGPPRYAAPHLLQRDTRSPLFIWDAGADTVELFFQPALAVLVEADNRWWYQPGGRQLRAFPDLGIRCRHVDSAAEVILVDAKLRRRTARGQELYKLLGYFANAGRPVRLGGLIFHEPKGFGSYGNRNRLQTGLGDGAGTIEVIAVEPGDVEGSARAFDVLARLVVAATGVPADQVEVLTRDDDEEGDTAERAGARAQALAVAQLQTLAGQFPSHVLETTSAHLRALLEDAWPQLGEEVQRMVKTAVHFGVTAPDGADLAGPVLGLCAPIERLLRERLAMPALSGVRGQPGCNAERWTLGTMLLRLREALGGGNGIVARQLRQHMDGEGLDLSSLATLVTDLDHLRSRYRNKAAHQGLMERPQWNEVFRLVLRSDDALLPRLVSFFPAASD